MLITQNNHIDIATGILTASLNLTRIDNKALTVNVVVNNKNRNIFFIV
jgi:hypothetical protein